MFWKWTTISIWTVLCISSLIITAQAGFTLGEEREVVSKVYHLALEGKATGSTFGIGSRIGDICKREGLFNTVELMLSHIFKGYEPIRFRINGEMVTGVISFPPELQCLHMDHVREVLGRPIKKFSEGTDRTFLQYNLGKYQLYFIFATRGYPWNGVMVLEEKG